MAQLKEGSIIKKSTGDEVIATVPYVDGKVQTDVPVNAKFTDTTYTGGTNVTISGTTINAVNTTYTAGTNMSLTGTVFSAIDTVPTKSNVESALGYSINSSVPSGAKFTDTVYTHPASHPASMITDLPTGKKVARFVVGTSTAGWTAADCDYLCDGTADETEINNAITALPATGGEIVILDGTYNITAKIDVTKDNVSIKGNGDATILKRMFNSSGYEGVITLIGRSGCMIADLQVDGNKTSYTNYTHFGIYLGLSSNNNNITGNTSNNNNNGIYVAFSSNDNTITGNTCNNNNDGIYLEESSNNIITSNHCNNNSAAGIYLGLSSNNNNITGNTSNNNDNGIYVVFSSDSTITGNTCNSNSTAGIYLEDSSNNSITGNHCNGNNGIGICLEDSSNNNNITGNTCNNNDAGIYLGSSSDITIAGNTCNNNSTAGIYLEVSSINAVTGNTCIRGTGLATDYAASQHTIYLSSTDNSYNLISNNNCMGKAPVIEGGIGNTITDNKWSNSSGRILENYTEQLVILSGTSPTIDLSLANVFTHALTGNTTYSITNAVSGQAHSFTLIITQTATVRTLTFPASVRWQGGEIPDMSTANKIYTLTFMSVDGGANWLGMFGGEF